MLHIYASDCTKSGHGGGTRHRQKKIAVRAKSALASYRTLRLGALITARYRTPAEAAGRRSSFESETPVSPCVGVVTGRRAAPPRSSPTAACRPGRCILLPKDALVTRAALRGHRSARAGASFLLPPEALPSAAHLCGSRCWPWSLFPRPSMYTLPRRLFVTRAAPRGHRDVRAGASFPARTEALSRSAPARLTALAAELCPVHKPVAHAQAPACHARRALRSPWRARARIFCQGARVAFSSPHSEGIWDARCAGSGAQCGSFSAALYVEIVLDASAIVT